MNNKNAEGYADPTAILALARVARDEKAAAKHRLAAEAPQIVYVASAYRGDVERNTERAKKCCRFVLKQKAVPFAPHLLYPQFLNDGDDAERK
jgi:hypothetical protein